MPFERLSERYLPLVDTFHCVENDEQLQGLSSKVRRRIKNHSKEMELFLKKEAYFEQEIGMNTTYLLLNDEETKICAYLSLCNDAIKLELEEREREGVTYSSAPAIKIARLAVDNSMTRRGIGTYLVEYAAFIANLIRERSGVFFITLDCYAHRVSFYEKIGFVQNNIQPEPLPYDTPISMRIGLDSYLERIASQESS